MDDKILYWNHAKRVQRILLSKTLDTETLEMLDSLFKFYDRVHDICWSIESENYSDDDVVNLLRTLRTTNPLELFM